MLHIALDLSFDRDRKARYFPFQVDAAIRYPPLGITHFRYMSTAVPRGQRINAREHNSAWSLQPVESDRFYSTLHDLALDFGFVPLILQIRYTLISPLRLSSPIFTNLAYHAKEAPTWICLLKRACFRTTKKPCYMLMNSRKQDAKAASYSTPSLQRQL